MTNAELFPGIPDHKNKMIHMGNSISNDEMKQLINGSEKLKEFVVKYREAHFDDENKRHVVLFLDNRYAALTIPVVFDPITEEEKKIFRNVVQHTFALSELPNEAQAIDHARSNVQSFLICSLFQKERVSPHITNEVFAAKCLEYMKRPLNYQGANAVCDVDFTIYFIFSPPKGEKHVPTLIVSRNY